MVPISVVIAHDDWPTETGFAIEQGPKDQNSIDENTVGTTLYNVKSKGVAAFETKTWDFDLAPGAVYAFQVTDSVRAWLATKLITSGAAFS